MIYYTLPKIKKQSKYLSHKDKYRLELNLLAEFPDRSKSELYRYIDLGYYLHQETEEAINEFMHHVRQKEQSIRQESMLFFHGALREPLPTLPKIYLVAS
jgi:hypothetical protein